MVAWLAVDHYHGTWAAEVARNGNVVARFSQSSRINGKATYYTGPVRVTYFVTNVFWKIDYLVGNLQRVIIKVDLVSSTFHPR